MIPAYNGSKPYIFVSYAHKDSAKVYKTIEILTSLGYRIWYDEGIKPGVEWPENIASHLDRCSLFMMFISPNSMDSANCRREINFALSRAKKFLCIVLEETEIPLGMELQLASQQSILRYKFSSEDAFLLKVCSAAGMAECKEGYRPPKYKASEAAPAMDPDAASSARRTAASGQASGAGKPARKKAAPGTYASSASKGSGGSRRRRKSGRKRGKDYSALIGLLIGTAIVVAFIVFLIRSFDASEFLNGSAALTPTVSVTPALTMTPAPSPSPVPAAPQIPAPGAASAQNPDNNAVEPDRNDNNYNNNYSSQPSNTSPSGNGFDEDYGQDNDEVIVDIPDDDGYDEDVPDNTGDDGGADDQADAPVEEDDGIDGF